MVIVVHGEAYIYISMSYIYIYMYVWNPRGVGHGCAGGGGESCGRTWTIELGIPGMGKSQSRK